MKCTVLLAAVVIAGPASAQDIPGLTGTWRGAGDGLSMEDGPLTGPITVSVSEQSGRSFRAEIAYSTRDGEERERLVGTLSPDGTSIYFAGDDGILLGSVAGSTMDACYLETDDDDAFAGCARLTRQP